MPSRWMQQRGLLRGRGELGVAREVRVGLVEPAQLEQGARAPDVRVGGAGDPVVRLRQLDQLGRELQPLRRAAGPPAGVQGAGQRRRERLGPAHPARHRDRLVGDRPHARPRGPARGSCGGPRCRASTCARIGESSAGSRSQRLLQQRDVLGVLDAVLLPGAAGVPERRAGEGVRGPGGAGGDRGAGEARARRLPLAGVRLGGGQRVLELGELGRVGVLVAAPQRRSRRPAAAPPRRRRAGSAPARRPARRRRRRGRPPRGPAAPKCRASSASHGSGRASWSALDRLADPQVQPRAPGRRELGLERGAQQRVGERVAAGRARDLHQQRAAHGGVEDVEQLVLGQAGDRLEQRRGRSRGRSGRRRRARGRRARTAGRRGPRSRRARPAGTPAAATGAPSSSSRWRASCLTKNGLPPVSAWIAETAPGAASPPISCATSRSSMPSRRTRGSSRPRSSSASSSGSGCPGCSSESRNVPTIRTAPSCWLARDVAGEQQRGPVGPVEVVDDHQHRPVRREPAHDGHDGAEQLAALRLGVAGGRQRRRARAGARGSRAAAGPARARRARARRARPPACGPGAAAACRSRARTGTAPPRRSGRRAPRSRASGAPAPRRAASCRCRPRR